MGKWKFQNIIKSVFEWENMHSFLEITKQHAGNCETHPILFTSIAANNNRNEIFHLDNNVGNLKFHFANLLKA